MSYWASLDVARTPATCALTKTAYGVECSGDHDSAPRLLSGKAPVFPASMLSPSYVDERRVKFLATHSNAAISAWRFEPARQGGDPVAVQCEHRLVFKLER